MHEEILELSYRKPSFITTSEEILLQRLFTAYLDNITAYVSKDTLTDPYTGMKYPPNEQLMEAVEKHVGLHPAMIDDWRKQILGTIGIMAHKGMKISWDSIPRLSKALKAKLHSYKSNKWNILLASKKDG